MLYIRKLKIITNTNILMKKQKILLLISIFFISQFSIAEINQDSLKIIQLENKINTLENYVKTIDKNQLNYKIEKDLLKETYSNNYDSINMIITIILGIIGIIGYLGIRDINSIKKEYLTELGKLKSLQTDFENKSNEFNVEKNKFDTEIKQILLENEKQNNKIKFIELKEKIKSFLKDNKLYESLDFIGVALDIYPEDETILRCKARTLCRLNKLPDSLTIYKKLHKQKPDDKVLALELIESMIFAKDFQNAETLIEKFSIEYNDRSKGMLAELLNLFKLYYKNEDLMEGIKKMIDFENLDTLSKKITDWDLTDAKFVAAHLPDSEQKIQLQNITWYLDGQINGKTLCSRLNILPE